MRRWLVAAVLAMALAGGAYWYATARARQEMQAGLDAFRASLPAGSTFTYATAAPDMLGGSAHLTDARLVNGDSVYTAASADVTPSGPNTLRHLSLRDVTEQVGGSKVTVGSVEADGASAPPGAAGVAQAGAANVTVDHAVLRDFRTTSGSTGGLSVGVWTIDGYGRGRPAVVEMRTVAVTAPDGSFDVFTLGVLRVGGIDLTQFAEGRPEPTKVLSGNAVTLDIDAMRLVKNDDFELQLASLHAQASRDGADRAELHATMQDVTVAPDPRAKPELKQLGYDRVQLTATLDGAVDRPARTLLPSAFDLEAVGMGHLHLALALDNLPPALLTPTPGVNPVGAAAAELVGLQVRSLALTYDDQSLLPHLTALAARQQHADPAALTAQAQARLRAAASGAGVPDSFVAPVSAFLADPHRLMVELHPPQPVPVIGLPSLIRGDPEQTLGLRVTN